MFFSLSSSLKSVSCKNKNKLFLKNNKKLLILRMKKRSEHQPEERHTCVQGTAITPGPTSQERRGSGLGGQRRRPEPNPDPPRPRAFCSGTSQAYSVDTIAASLNSIKERKRPEDNGTATSTSEERCLAQSPHHLRERTRSQHPQEPRAQSGECWGRATARRQGSTPTCGQRCEAEHRVTPDWP